MTEIRLSPAMRLGVIVAGVAMLLMVGGIFAQLLVLQDTNDRIHATDGKISDLKGEVDPILDVVRPLIGDARPAVREARALADPLSATLDDVSTAAEEAPPLARAVRTVIGRSIPLIDTLRAESLPLLDTVRLSLTELRDLMPKAVGFLDEAKRRALLARADAAIAAALHIESIQERSLRAIRKQLAIQKQTLAVQLEALDHIESLDAKTGGEFPPTAD